MDVTYHRLNPLRQPQWRYEHVVELHLLNRRPARWGPAADEYIWHYYRFFTHLLAAGDNQRLRGEAIDLRPHFAAAHFIHFSDDTFTRQILQARILSRQTNDEIAVSMGIAPECVKHYERVFFNIREKLDASSYIQKAAIRPPEPRARNRTERADQLRGYSLRLFGYFGGPLVVDFLVQRFRTGENPRSYPEARDWLAAAIGDAVAIRGAAAVLDEQLPLRLLIKLALQLRKKTTATQ
jgi:hypothetical protein